MRVDDVRLNGWFEDARLLARLACGMPAAVVSLMTADGRARSTGQRSHDWFTAHLGDWPSLTAIAVVSGAARRPETAPFCSALSSLGPEAGVFAAVPLTLLDGAHVGAIFVWQSETKELDGDSLIALASVARVLSCSLASALEASESRRAAWLTSEVVTMVAHELRTPLTVLRGSLALLDADTLGLLSPPAKECVASARSSAERLVVLVNDVLDLDRLGAADFTLERAPVEPEALVRAALAAVSWLTTDRRVDVIGAADALFGDAGRLVHVLAHLVGNALRFTPPSLPVTISIETLTGRVRISVHDRGPGIAAESLPHLFRRFSQAQVSHSGGLGLGLTVSHAIVERHGGAMGVEAELGAGTTFWFEVPLAWPESPSNDEAAAP